MQRRARPLLGTLVEIGAADGRGLADAFDAIAEVQAALSRFEPASDVVRFNRLDAGSAIELGADASIVLAAASRLAAASAGRFDVALGSGRWRLDGSCLVKLDAATRLDLGGIAKGHAVDRAIAALRAAGCRAGHVNAGGDLRCFGADGVQLRLRDEARGGTREFGLLHDGAFATSHFAPASHSQLTGGRGQRHVSVLAPECLWADALTKFAALGIELPPEFGATAWVH